MIVTIRNSAIWTQQNNSPVFILLGSHDLFLESIMKLNPAIALTFLTNALVVKHGTKISYVKSKEGNKSNY